MCFQIKVLNFTLHVCEELQLGLQCSCPTRFWIVVHNICTKMKAQTSNVRFYGWCFVLFFTYLQGKTFQNYMYWDGLIINSLIQLTMYLFMCTNIIKCTHQNSLWMGLAVLREITILIKKKRCIGRPRIVTFSSHFATDGVKLLSCAKFCADLLLFKPMSKWKCTVRHVSHNQLLNVIWKITSLSKLCHACYCDLHKIKSSQICYFIQTDPVLCESKHTNALHLIGTTRIKKRERVKWGLVTLQNIGKTYSQLATLFSINS